MPNPEIRSSQSGQTGFRLHYFPDIPVDDRDSGQRCLPVENKFKRIQNRSVDIGCANFASGLTGNKAANAKRSMSAAEQIEQAYQSGFAEGIKQGMLDGENKGVELGKKEIEPLMISLQEALTQFKHLREETYRSIEKEVVELALAIARQVICREVAMDREIVVCVAREALAKVEDSGKIKIKMSTADVQFINETRHQLSSLIANIDDITFEAEENIQSGGCIIETDLGEIDARIEKQLQAVEESFRMAVEKTSN